MKFDKKILIFSDAQERQSRFVVGPPASTLIDGVLKRGRLKFHEHTRWERSGEVHKTVNVLAANTLVSNNVWRMTFGEYLMNAMMDQEVYPHHIAEETGLPREYVDQILEDEILPWQLSSCLIRYLNERLNLDEIFTKRIIKVHPISPFVLERLHYSESEYKSIDLMDQRYRKKRFGEFLVQEESRRKEFLRVL